MRCESLDKLFCLLDVRLNAVALCEMGKNKRLLLPPAENILVHYILEGHGILRMADGSTAEFGPDTLVFVPITAASVDASSQATRMASSVAR